MKYGFLGMMNWDYLAGWFDAAGSVMICEYPAKYNTASRQKTYTKRYVQVAFGNTDYELIKAIRDFLGLQHRKISCQKASSKNKMVNDFYRLLINKRSDAKRILQALKPRCHIKKKDIIKALEYLKFLEQLKTRKKKKRKRSILYS